MRLPPRSDWPRLYHHHVRDAVKGARLNLLHRGMRALPVAAVSAIGGRLGRLAGSRYPVASGRARAAALLARPDLASDEAALAALVGRAWEAIGRSYAEFSVEDRMWPAGLVTVEGAEHLAAAGEGSRPVIVAGLHLGNWELLPITCGYLGHRIIDVYQPQANRFEDRIAMRTRMRAAAQVGRATGRAVDAIFKLVSPSPRAGAELLAALRDRWTLMMYVDEDAGGRIQAPAFGRAPGKDGNVARVARLARMANAAVVPAYAERLAGARFVVRFLPPLALRRTDDREGDLLANIAALDAAITGPIRDHLDQWFMLPDYRIG